MKIANPSTRRAVERAFLGALLVATMIPASLADTPTVTNYQGRLTDNSPQQNPINASLPMEFRIYDSATTGVLLWSEVWPSVSVTSGTFSVLLGSNGSPLPASIFTDGTSRFLEVVINGEVLSPRQQIGTVPYAARSQHSDDSPGLQVQIGTEAAARAAGDAAAVTSANQYTDAAVANEATARAAEDQVLHGRIDSISGGGLGTVDVVTDRPANPPTGRIVFSTTTGTLDVFDGQRWQETRLLPAGDCFPGSILLDANQKHQIDQWYGNVTQKWQLCYRRSTHGATGTAFHTQCNNLGETITVIRMNGDLRLLGGYSEASWSNTTGYVASNAAFLFSLTYNEKYPIDPTRSQFSIYNNSTYGPTFGGGFDFHLLPNMTTGYCFFPWSYICDGKSGVSDPACHTRLCGAYNTWTVEEVETFYAVPGGCDA